MMKDSIFKCDGPNCSAVRGEANHWLISYKATKAFIVQPWDSADAMVEDAVHLCGDTCALKFLSEWLSARRRNEQRTMANVATEPEPRVRLGDEEGTSGMAGDADRVSG